MSLDFRPYQLEDMAALEQAWQGPQNRLGLVWATGLGKTHGIAHQAVKTVHEGGRAVVVAHRDELLGQITQRIGQHDPRIPVGRVQAGTDQCRRRLVVASAQTIANPRRLERLGRFQKVIVDEAHHYAAPTFRGILEGLGSFDGVPTLGVTATMRRDDKKHGLGDVWEGIVAERDIVWAVEHGWLVPPRGKVVVADHMDLEHAKLNRGDYSDGELGSFIEQDVEQIARAWIEHGEGRTTVAFCPTVASSQALAEAFRALGVPAGEIYGKTVERGPVYDDLKAGRIKVLCSVMVPSEGWDAPWVSCILQCRPTRSRTLFTQIVGRGLRLYPGKVDCLVLDVVGSSRGQKLFGLTELLPSAVVDTSATEALPCDLCGQPRRSCDCPREIIEKPANRLVGPARYEEIDLLNQSGLRWLVTKQGIRFLPTPRVGRGPARAWFLWPDSHRVKQVGGTWSIMEVNLAGDHAELAWLDDGVPHTLLQAQQLAEAAALRRCPTLAADQAAPWRTGRAKPAQITWAASLGVEHTDRYTAGRCSDEIEVALATARLEQGIRAAGAA